MFPTEGGGRRGSPGETAVSEPMSMLLETRCCTSALFGGEARNSSVAPPVKKPAAGVVNGEKGKVLAPKLDLRASSWPRGGL